MKTSKHTNKTASVQHIKKGPGQQINPKGKETNDLKKSGAILKREHAMKIMNITILGLFISLVLYYTIGKNSEFILKLQDLDLFIYDKTYFLETVGCIGGLVIYIGSFLNQFFYIPALGTFIYLLMLLLLSVVTAKVFKLKGWSYPLSYIPSLALLLSMTEVGYMVFLLKVDGYVFVSILGVLTTLVGLMLIKKQSGILSQTLTVFGYLLIAYPVAGVYALMGGLLMVLHILKQTIILRKPIHLIPVIIGLLLLGAVPVCYYTFVFYQTAFVQLFYVNLPNFFPTGPEKILWLPFLIMAIFFMVATLWHKPIHEKKELTLKKMVIPVVLFFVMVCVVVRFSFNDKTFTTELSMMSASQNEEWNKVLLLSRKYKEEPSRLMVMNTNLALYKLGLASDNLYFYKDGNKPINCPRHIIEVQIAGPFYYFQYGKMNYCYKWCMEGMVEYGMNAYYLNYFVLSCIFNGEKELAQKYNDILKKTLFHRKWANDHQPFIDDPGLLETNSSFNKIKPLTRFDDYLDGDHGLLEHYIRNSFAFLRGGPPEMVELCILYNMELKNIERFWPAFFYWCKTNKRIPVHFQEAALIYNHLEHKYPLDLSRFDKTVLANFDRFLAFVKQYANYPESAVKDMYYKQFGNTFWYYYFFVNDHSNSNAKGKSSQYSS